MRLFLISLAFLASTLLAGCKSGSSKDPEDPDTRPPEAHFDILHSGQTLLDGAVLVKTVFDHRRDDRTLEAYEAELENRTDGPLSIEYRTLWKGSNDELLGEGAWTSLQIPPKETVVIEAEPTDSSVRYGKLEVRKKP